MYTTLLWEEGNLETYLYRYIKKGYQKNVVWCINSKLTVDPKYFDYWFLATLDEREQGIPNDGG